MDEATARIEELRDLIHHHDRRYHVDDAPEIPDADYDAFLSELRVLEAEHPGLITPDSPTQRAGAPGRATFAEVRHRVPMRSLDNAFNFDELRAWTDRVLKRLDDSVAPVTWACELKFDGLAVSLRYEDGLLVQA
ncbi:MAG TPA: NAD-dependent DNA ligase LigA, partial [Acidimicrobiaceae bacterium]|nr:NAD-dependent DNA ligase LigA [Acidimicrobiaceae bacterium]